MKNTTHSVEVVRTIRSVVYVNAESERAAREKAATLEGVVSVVGIRPEDDIPKPKKITWPSGITGGVFQK